MQDTDLADSFWFSVLHKDTSTCAQTEWQIKLSDWQIGKGMSRFQFSYAALNEIDE